MASTTATATAPQHLFPPPTRRDILGRALFRAINFPLICLVVGALSHPLYLALHRWFRDVAEPELIQSWAWGLAPSWSTTDDALVALVLAISINTMYILENSVYLVGASVCAALVDVS